MKVLNFLNHYAPLLFFAFTVVFAIIGIPVMVYGFYLIFKAGLL